MQVGVKLRRGITVLKAPKYEVHIHVVVKDITLKEAGLIVDDVARILPVELPYDEHEVLLMPVNEDVDAVAVMVVADLLGNGSR